MILIQNPENTDYKLEVIGTDTGKYSLSTTLVNTDGTIENNDIISKTQVNKIDTFNIAYDGNIPDTSVDLIPPEAIFSFDALNKKLNIEGVDDNTGVVVTNKKHNYTVRDLAGNIFTMKVRSEKEHYKENHKHRKDEEKINYFVNKFSYDSSQKPFKLGLKIKFSYNLEVDGSYKQLTQSIIAKDFFNISAMYTKDSNQTIINITKPNNILETKVEAGMKIIKIKTNQGLLEYEF